MPTLNEIRSEAQRLAADLHRSEVCRGIVDPPSPDDLRDFLGDVVDAGPDDCDDCRSVTDCAQGFSEIVSRDKPDPEELREALAILLESTGIYGSPLRRQNGRTRAEARQEVALFLRLAKID